MTTKAKILLGVCGALAAGVVISLLVAPEKTKKVGRNLKKSAGKWVDKMGNIFSRVEHEAADMGGKVKSAL
jgi:hypothetical protein